MHATVAAVPTAAAKLQAHRAEQCSEAGSRARWAMGRAHATRDQHEQRAAFGLRTSPNGQGPIGNPIVQIAPGAGRGGYPSRPAASGMA